jgi:hypothetical protein
LEASELAYNLITTDNVLKELSEFVICMIGTIKFGVEIFRLEHDGVKGSSAVGIVRFCLAEKILNFPAITKVWSNFCNSSS